MAHIRQSRPGCGHGFRVKVLETFYIVPSSLESGTSSEDYGAAVQCVDFPLFTPCSSNKCPRFSGGPFRDVCPRMVPSSLGLTEIRHFCKFVNFPTLHPYFRRIFQRCPRRGWSRAGPTKYSTALRILSRSKTRNSHTQKRLDGPEIV